MAQWAGIMRERKESGLSIREFCKNAGFHENRYFYWQKRLREAACEKLAKIENNEERIAQPVFAKLDLPAPAQPISKPLALTSQASQGHISIEVPGARITACHEYPVENLKDLLRAVMQPCC